MSIAQNPLTGPMKKSVANFTMYTYKGMNIVRSKAFTIHDPKTEKQLLMRARMSEIAVMYGKLSPVIVMGFPERDENKSPQNMFVASNFKTAFEMVDNVQVISYPLMLVAKGSLPPVTITEATIDAGGLNLKYDAYALAPVLNADDEIITCTLLKSGSLYKTKQFIGHEAIGTIRLNCPDLLAEEVECCYAFVRNQDGEKASNSVWVEVNIV